MDMMLSDLRKMISINSVCEKSDSPDHPFGENVRKVVETALDICKGYGFRIKNNNNMAAYAEVGTGSPLMGILVHLDIVPAGEGWNHDPFDMKITEDKIYGRGVTDDKGPAAAVIHAIRELLEEGVIFNKRVRIIFGMAEETGEWEDMEYYNQYEEKVDFGFTPDADFPAIYGEKGLAHLRFVFDKSSTCFDHISGGTALNMVPDCCTASGHLADGEYFEIEVKGKAAHGSTPEDGENAISKLMSRFSDSQNCRLVEFFHKFIRMEYDGKSLGGYFSDEESGPITYNIGLIETAGDRITVSVDVRYPVTCHIEEIISAVNHHLAAEGFEDIQAELLSDTPYVYMDKNGPVIRKLMEAYREHTGDSSEPALIGGGTYARAMDGIVAFGPMFPGRELTEHQANEYIFRKDLDLAKEIYKTAIRKLAAQ